ncbi:MAG: hypothetical protein IKM84_07560 [Oscillospiraceae bacterium]|nr:hypothetical protein [Oscillospiraceae bacterium]
MREERYQNGQYDATLGEMAGRRLYVYGIVDSVAPSEENTTDAELELHTEEPAGRLDAALYLYRLFGWHPESDCPFSDVPEAFQEAVSWLYEAGATKGIGGNRYGIGSITEHQLLVMLSRYFHWGSEDPDTVRDMANRIELLPSHSEDRPFSYGDLYQILSAVLDQLCPERCVSVRPEMSAPHAVLLRAETAEDALAQIAAALDYVPECVVVQFPADCPAQEVEAFVQRFAPGGAALPARLVACIDWSFLVPYTLIRYPGNRFKFCVNQYTPATEATADALDWLRVYRDAAYTAALADFAAQYLDPLKRLPGDYDRARNAHDLLCRLASYDHLEESSGSRPQAHSLLGFFQRRRLVCDGYAKTYQWMLRYLGVESYVVCGSTSMGEHGWNKVLLDGAWFNVDACWDDDSGDSFFLRSDFFFASSDHRFTDAFSCAAFSSPQNYRR